MDDFQNWFMQARKSSRGQNFGDSNMQQNLSQGNLPAENLITINLFNCWQVGVQVALIIHKEWKDSCIRFNKRLISYLTLFSVLLNKVTPTVLPWVVLMSKLIGLQNNFISLLFTPVGGPHSYCAVYWLLYFAHITTVSVWHYLFWEFWLHIKTFKKNTPE